MIHVTLIPVTNLLYFPLVLSEVIIIIIIIIISSSSSSSGGGGSSGSSSGSSSIELGQPALESANK